jgi:hypothetical protein
MLTRGLRALVLVLVGLVGAYGSGASSAPPEQLGAPCSINLRSETLGKVLASEPAAFRDPACVAASVLDDQPGCSFRCNAIDDGLHEPSGKAIALCGELGGECQKPPGATPAAQGLHCFRAGE